MNYLSLYGFPLMFDIIVSTMLFVGRHALASQGYTEKTVGSIVLGYGIGYVISSLLMPRIIKPEYAKRNMLGALAGLIVICLVLANTQDILVIQVLYCLFPFFSSLLFNAFQIYMLGLSNDNSRPLAQTAGHFTLAWSLGFAVGPFISSALKNNLDWAQIYYLVSLITLGIGIMLYFFKPHKMAIKKTEYEVPQVISQTGQNPSLVGPAWLGLLFGWMVLNAVLVYWPVQAVQMGIPAAQRGWVEFAYALVQGVSAFLLTYAGRWHYKIPWLIFLGSCGVASLGVFGISTTLLSFVLGAMLYGTYTGGMFSYVIYHSMIDESKAVKRVAINETIVGITYLTAVPVTTLLHQPGTPFGSSYFSLGLVLSGGVILQALYASYLMRRRKPILEKAQG